MTPTRNRAAELESRSKNAKDLKAKIYWWGRLGQPSVYRGHIGDASLPGKTRHRRGLRVI
jgi:hypothetical protein